MSHELRTPLNAILGFSEMILGQVYGEVPTALRVPLTDIQNSGKHLLRLINNVRELSKIEAGAHGADTGGLLDPGRGGACTGFAPTSGGG
jgi:signal transduction histidine kinase